MRLRRTPVLTLALAACFAGFASSGTTMPATSTACTPGVKTIAGKTARIFCGPAKATVRLGARTITYQQGECSLGGGGFAANIGTVIPGATRQKQPYFGVFVERATPGKYPRQTITFAHAGRVEAVYPNTLTLAKGLKAGTFEGRLLGSGRPVSGSFTC